MVNHHLISKKKVGLFLCDACFCEVTPHKLMKNHLLYACTYILYPWMMSNSRVPSHWAAIRITFALLILLTRTMFQDLLTNKKEPFIIAVYFSSILAPVQGKMIEFGDLYTHF